MCLCVFKALYVLQRADQDFIYEEEKTIDLFLVEQCFPVGKMVAFEQQSHQDSFVFKKKSPQCWLS